MEEYNIYGWTALHEACYKGYTNAVTRFLDYARETGKNLIEQRTIDDYKTTPVIIAALGGHLEIVDLLVQNGADINAELNFQKSKHGIIEIAAIRQHIELIVYLYNLIPDVPKRLKDLMVCSNLDKNTRASIGRTIELFSKEYNGIMKKLSKFKIETHEAKLKYLFDTEKIITYKLFSQSDFGLFLASYLKLNENNEDAISSCMLLILNLIENETIRRCFTQNNGIFYIVNYIENHKKRLKNLIESILKLLKKKSKDKCEDMFNDDSIDSFKDLSESEEKENKKITWVDCASIGQALNALSNYDDCLDALNKDQSNEKLIDYIKILFDFNNLNRLLQISNLDLYSNRKIIESLISKLNDGLIFEQYIGSYLSFLGNLVYDSQVNKRILNNSNLFELFLNFWKQILIVSNKLSVRRNDNENNKIMYFSTDVSLMSFNDYNFENLNHKDIKLIIDSIFEEKFLNSKISCVEKVTNTLSVLLFKNLKLTLIESIGKIIRHNKDLKEKYIFPSDLFYFTRPSDNDKASDDWVLNTVRFIRSLISLLEAITFIDKEYQMEVLRFLRNITDDDPEMQNRLVNLRIAFNSSLVNNFRNFLRKSSPFSIRSSALYCVWSLSGDKNYQECFDRKSIIYRAVGAQKFVDTLFEMDENLILICLEALTCMCNSPPYRDNDTNSLIYVQDDVAQVHAASAIVRILKSNNPHVLFACLKSISAMCVTIGYHNCAKNQFQFERLGTISLIIDISMRKHLSKRLRCEALMCLSMIILNNSNNRRVFFKTLGSKIDDFIEILISFLCDSNHQKESLIESLNTQLTAGLVICGFTYKNDDFIRRIIMTNGRIKWSVFRKILKNLIYLNEVALNEKNKERIFECEKMRCLYGFELAVLHNLISDADEDPRAIGMQILVDVIPKSSNSYLRSIACDYTARLICYNDCLVESLISINVVDILALSTIDNENFDVSRNDRQDVGITERGCAAIAIGFLTNLNAEARRILLRFAREQPRVMNALKYFNPCIHIDLITQWNHFKDLDISPRKEIKYARNKKEIK
ncbi:unnamed protein product [Brachionus calyciflorus]|uniref:Uncharacterized protein n=1 Tax=Brachionus calyciflorus TaxID=104777 RepID=A0A814FY63_9BILA|nr:unnamed protein product [Brachionus calyciflorus]